MLWFIGWIAKDCRDTVQFHQENMAFPAIDFFTKISYNLDPAWFYDAWHLFDFIEVCLFGLTIIIATKVSDKVTWYRMLIEMAAIAYVTHNLFFGWLLMK